MRKKNIVWTTIGLFLFSVFAVAAKKQEIIGQVRISPFSTTFASSAQLEVHSTTLGSLPAPSLSTSAKNAITSPATGLMVFDSTLGKYQIYNGSSWVDHVGQSSYSTGDILYASGANTLSKLSLGAANSLLYSTGSAPAYAQLTNAMVATEAQIARSKLAVGTASQVVVNDSSGNLTTESSLHGTRGGTGRTTLTAGNVLIGNGDAGVNFVAPSSSGNVLTSNGSSWESAAPASAPDEASGITNHSLAVSVAGNAATIALKTKAGSDPSSADVVGTSYREAVEATGTYDVVNTTSALSLTVSSGSTLGCVSAYPCRRYVYGVNNSGSTVLGIAGIRLDEGSLFATTAEGGAANSATVLYTTSAITTPAPVRLLGELLWTLTTAGTYNEVPDRIATNISNRNETTISEIVLDTGAGFGSTDTRIRILTNCTAYGNASCSSGAGSDFYSTTSAANGRQVFINRSGVYAVTYNDYYSGGVKSFGISVDATGELTTDILSVTKANRLCAVQSPAASLGVCAVTRRFASGSIIRPHTDGFQDGTEAYVQFRVQRISD